MSSNVNTNGYSLKGAQMIRDTKGLSLQERGVLGDANTRANAQHQFFIRVDTWAKALDIRPRTLQVHVATLIDKGLLQRTQRKGRSSVFKVLVLKNAESCTPIAQNPASTGAESCTHKTTSNKTSSSLKIELLDGEPPLSVGNPADTNISGKKQENNTGIEDIKAAAFELAESYYKNCCTSPKARVAFWSRLKRLRWPNIPSGKPKYHLYPDQVDALKSAMFGNAIEVQHVCHAIAHAICVWDPTQGENGKNAYPSPSDIVGQYFDESVLGLLKAVKDGAWPVLE